MIGVIGLGAMGAPMARNLLNAGKQVIVYDIRAEAVAGFAGTGAELATTVSDVARAAELVVTMVNDDSALRSVVFGEDGLSAGGMRDRVLVDLSSTSVALTNEIMTWSADAGCSYLDGAVIGGGAPAAQRGESPIVIAGESGPAEAVVQELACLGSWSYMGAVGNAKVTKIINNWLVGAMTASNGEALALGLAEGIELSTLYTSLLDGSAESTVLRSYIGSYLESGDYGAGLISIPMMEKDLALAISLGDQVAAPVISAEVAREVYRLAGAIVGRERPFPAVGELFTSLNK